jgi:hypothetical protein
MFYACHDHDHAKASVMHAQAGCFLSYALLVDDIMLLVCIRLTSVMNTQIHSNIMSVVSRPSLGQAYNHVSHTWVKHIDNDSVVYVRC